MTETVVTLVINELVQLIAHESKLLRGVHREVVNIRDELESIQCFLKDADKRDLQDGVKTWVKQKILLSMSKQIYQAKEAAPGQIDMTEEIVLISQLRKCLLHKRYVVVFDDVWKTEFWEIVKHALPCNDRGSRIIITTRSDLIGVSCKESLSDKIHKLQPLSQDKAWELFCRKAFQSEFQGCCPRELVRPSMDIVKKCEGLPLAIVAIGGLLSTKEKVPLEWQNLHDSLNSELERDTTSGGKSRCLSIHYAREDVFETSEYSRVRSVFLFSINEMPRSFLVKLFKKFKLLKVLDFEDAPIDCLPQEVGNLFHLKYLSLRRTKVKILPKSMGRLQNLQTLNVMETPVSELPIEIFRLYKLRHLLAHYHDLEIESSLYAMKGVKLCDGVGCLRDLQTLSLVEANHQGVGLFTELGKLSQLRALGISNMAAENGRDLCASLQRYDGERLHFEEGGFQKLKKLTLKKLNRLKMIEIDTGSLPVLEQLEIGPCPQMKEVPSGIQHLKSLKVIDFYEMQREFVLHLQPDRGKDYWKVKKVTTIRFGYRIKGERYQIYKLVRSTSSPTPSSMTALPLFPTISSPNPLAGIEVEGLELQEAYFRGRKLQGTAIPTPQGFYFSWMPPVYLLNTADWLINEASDKVLEVEQQYNGIRRPFLSHPALGELLTEEDQKIFEYLSSLEVEDFKDVKSGYSITLHFNPILTNAFYVVYQVIASYCHFFSARYDYAVDKI
ncbi:hypothetical protein FH972_001145 [Carpinus fangiana]|uniref:NB-ARC domain-containing protein n=1 Tax=Carpinus fangiana TaxID=176857 RepID=A0A5N6QAU8_9ROSI|nr:hypothetical protein FH972_001145 [Carpinus fangiana]